MIYTNDDNDRKQRRQNYILTVYILPVFVAAICCAVIYFTTRFYNLDGADQKSGYVISLAIGFIVWFKNKFKWLPLPDGSHYYINRNQADEDMAFEKQASMTEPSNYDMIFRYSKVDSAITLICGIILTSVGFYIMKRTSIIFPLLIIASGLFMLVQGYKTFIDTTPRLKLSKQGLWTQKLGFHSWASIKKAKIVRHRGYRSTQTSLEIYLVDGRFKNVDHPDETLSLNDIKDSNKIEKLINEFSS